MPGVPSERRHQSRHRLEMTGSNPVIVTAGTEEKCIRCRELGAEVAVNYRDADFATAVRV